MGIFSCTEKQNSVTLHSEIRKTDAISMRRSAPQKKMTRPISSCEKALGNQKEKSAKTTYKYFSGNSPATLYRQGHRITN